MSTTPRTKIPYPEPDAEPWMSMFESMMLALDNALYASREDRNVVISGGGTLTFNATTGVLTWSDTISILAPITGYLWNIPAGNVTLSDGQLFYISVTRGPQSSQTFTPSVDSIVPSDGDTQLLIGWRKGTVVHFRDGHAIGDQDSKVIFDNPTGAGGSGSPAGSNGEVQFKSGSSFSGATNVTYDGSNLVLATGLKFKNGSNVGVLQMTPTGSKTLTLPDATDVLMGRQTTDTVQNKTMLLSANTLTETGATAGAMIRHNGTRFAALAVGTAYQVPMVNAAANDVTFSYPAVLGPNASGYAQVTASEVRNTSNSKLILSDVTGNLQTSGSSPGVLKSWSLTDSRLYAIRAMVTVTNGSSHYAEFSVKALYTRFAGTVTNRYKTIVPEIRSNASLSVDLVINGTAVELQVTGLAATTLQWVVEELVHEGAP